MKCFRPRKVYDGDFSSEYPCGKCAACLRSRTREWANRITHELSYHESSCFLTLTYDNENLPDELKKRDLQLFLKRLRKEIEPKRIKYFGCGEYGETYGRPHYHLIVFGIGVKDDLFKLQKTLFGKNYYRMDAWTFGFIDVGVVNYKSAAYVAGYIQKKLKVEACTGKALPFQVQSQGLGKKYVEDNAVRLVDNLGFTVNGAKCGLPRYYRKVLGDRIDQEDLNDVALEKSIVLDEFLEDSGYDPIDDRSEYKGNVRALKKRELEQMEILKEKHRLF